MFCPKCGATLPDGAGFCGQCGEQLAQRPNPTAHARPVTPVPGTTTPGVTIGGSNVAPMDLLGRILAVVSVILLFMPIINIPQLATYANSLSSSQLGSLLGSSASSYASNYGIDLNMLMSGSYSALDLNAIMGYIAKSAGSSGGIFTMLGALIVLGMLLMVALLVIGLVMSFTGKKSTKVLRVGGVVVCAMALSLAIGTIAGNSALQQQLSSYSSSSYGLIGAGTASMEVPITVWLLVICSIASYVLIQKATSDALAGEVEYPDPLAVASIASCLTGIAGVAVGIVAIVRNADPRNKKLAIIGLVITCVLILLSIIVTVANGR